MPKKCVGVELIAIFNPGVTPSVGEWLERGRATVFALAFAEGSKQRCLLALSHRGATGTREANLL